jgi:hypothetical protein
MKKLALFAILLGATAAQAMICKTADQKIAFIYDDTSLMGVCNPIGEKSAVEVCGKDLFVLSSMGSTNETKILFHISQASKTQFKTSMTNEKVEVELNSDYAANSYQGNNKIVAPKGIYTLQCK